MFKKILFPAVWVFAITSFASAMAVEQANNCRLKGGSMVLLAVEACVMEGGALFTQSPAVEASMKLSSDPKLASAQRAAIELLNKTVVETDLRKRDPEGIERAVKFDGCKLLADENMHVDHGKFLSTRMNFKISSMVDMSKVSGNAFGVLGQISSIGGGLKAHAVYFEEPRRKDGNHIDISVIEQKADGPRKYVFPGPNAYWDAPRDDLWMVDEIGYPKERSSGNLATDTIRILFIVNTADDAASLKKALDDVQALCKP